MFIDHSALKYLVNKPVLGSKIFRWLLLFQEFDFETIVNPGRLNAGPDHLSRIKTGEELTNIEYGLPNVQLFRVGLVNDYYEKIVQFFATGTEREGFTTNQKKQLVIRAMDFQLIAGELYKMRPNEH